MSRRLESNVFVDGQWYGPSYPDAGDPPSGVNEKVFGSADGEESPAPVDAAPDRTATQAPLEPALDPEPMPLPEPALEPARTDPPPPHAGPGSGKSAWLDYAIKHDVRVRDDAPRDDIIAACQAAGVRTE